MKKIKILFCGVFVFCIFFQANCSSRYDYQLSIAAIFQDEAPYLREWIEYHKLIGVEHFYLLNNLSQDNYQEVLSHYISSGEVELIEWPYLAQNLAEWDSIQVLAYQHALQIARNKTKWLAVIDTDEFIVPVKGDNLTKLLKSYSSGLGGLCMPWFFFGTSFVEKIPEDQLLIENLTMHSGPAAGGIKREIWKQGAYKSVFRTKYVTQIVSPHYCQYIPGRAHRMAKNNLVRINHYWSRDGFYLRNYKIPRRQRWGQLSDSVLHGASCMTGHTDNNPILRFIPKLKEKMQVR